MDLGTGEKMTFQASTVGTNGGGNGAPHFAAANLPGDAVPLAERVRSLQLPREVTASRRGWRWLVWPIGLAAIGAVAYFGYLQFAARAAGGKPNSDGKIPATPVTASDSPASATVAPAAEATVDGDVILESKGYVVPVHEILVSPKISGMVEKLDIIEGQRVEQGKVLAVLESTDYKADLDHSQAMLASAKQRLLELEHGSRPEEIREARAELDEASEQIVQLKSQWERTKKLHDGGGRVVTDDQYEQASSAYYAMLRHVDRLRNAYDLMVLGPRVEKVDAARADVATAQADYDKAKWRLDNCIVRAPVSGTILKKNAEEGNIVNPIVFNGSYSICDMANLLDLEVDLTIQERDISNVFAGQRCKIHTEAFPDRIYDGYVSRLMPIADRAKGAIPVRVKLNIPPQEEGLYFKPEMGAVVSFYKKAGATKTP